MAGLYIHIPFCASRCIYCGFYSTTLDKLKDRYVKAVCKEIESSPNHPSGEDVMTVYLGGGTPSQLSDEQLTKIFEAIKKKYPHLFSSQSEPHNIENEITIECNPDDVTLEFARQLVALGINRVSMGAQTFNDERLKFLHRRHNAEDVIMAVQRLRSAGIHNISIDLMFGFPNETLESWEEDIWMALALNPQHISAYSLMYEEGTILYQMLKKKEICEIDDDLSLSMYNKLIDMLTSAGYEHYEISNFARPGFRSRHNSSYWHEIPYIGIGAAAHSYNKVSRSWNVADIMKYMEGIESGHRVYEKEDLDINTRYDDLITTALRTREGINLKKMNEEYGDELYAYLTKGARKYIEQGLMKIEDNHLSFTRKGLYISDTIMSELMHV